MTTWTALVVSAVAVAAVSTASAAVAVVAVAVAAKRATTRTAHTTHTTTTTTTTTLVTSSGRGVRTLVVFKIHIRITITHVEITADEGWAASATVGFAFVVLVSKGH